MKRPKSLSDTFVKRIAQPGRYGDGGTRGLSLHVRKTKTGRLSKTWCQRLEVKGQEAHLGLGSYPKVSLRDARARAIANAHAVNEGEDPRPRKNVPTFKEAAGEVLNNLRGGWRGSASEERWVRSLEMHVYPRLGDVAVEGITSSDVLAVLKPLWVERHATAILVRQAVYKVLWWCQALDHVDENVADDRIDGALPPVRGARKHHPALPYKELADALLAIDLCGAMPSSKLCFRFLVLTAARSGEARLARWNEIDMEKLVWTVPGERMKRGIRQCQPLSAAALRVLNDARALEDDSDLVFPSQKYPGRPISESAMPGLLSKVGLARSTTVHGLRSTFRDWATECTEANNDVKELCLAHAVGSEIKEAYFNTNLLEQRRDLLNRWGGYVCGVDTPGALDSLGIEGETA